MKKIHINNDNNWCTPLDFYKKLDDEFHFDFDPCPYSEEPILLCKDGLLIDWSGKTIFINPPYSRKLKEAFVLRAIKESKQGKVCVMLLPVSTSTSLFKDHIEREAKEIRFIKGRIKFGKLDAEGKFYIPLNKKGKKQSGTKDSMIVIFDNREK